MPTFKIVLNNSRRKNEFTVREDRVAVLKASEQNEHYQRGTDENSVSISIMAAVSPPQMDKLCLIPKKHKQTTMGIL